MEPPAAPPAISAKASARVEVLPVTNDWCHSSLRPYRNENATTAQKIAAGDKCPWVLLKALARR